MVTAQTSPHYLLKCYNASDFTHRSSTVYQLIMLAIYCLTLCLLIGNGSDAAIRIKM